MWCHMSQFDLGFYLSVVNFNFSVLSVLYLENCKMQEVDTRLRGVGFLNSRPLAIIFCVFKNCTKYYLDHFQSVISVSVSQALPK